MIRSKRMRQPVAMAALVAVLIPLVGCGSSGSSGKASSKGSTTVKVGSLPFGVTVGAALGVHKGFFKQAGLDVKFVTTQNTAAAIAGVQSGSIDIAGAGNTALLAAIAQGVPLKIIAPQAGTVPGGQCILAKPGTTPDQIKTYGVNTLAGDQQITGRLWLRSKGIDDSKVKFLQVPYPNMATAVQQGQVDAVDSIVPFTVGPAAHGMKCLGDSLPALAPYGSATAVWFTTDSFIQQHPDVVKSWVAAQLKANRYTIAHPSEGQAELVGLMGVTADQAKHIPLFAYPLDFRLSAMQKEIDIGSQIGIISKHMSAKDLFWSGATFAPDAQ